MEATMRILDILKLLQAKGCYSLKTDHMRVKAYTDIDGGGSMTNGRSTPGYCTFVGGNLVTWRCKRHLVARSCAEAEFKTMALDICEIMWIKTLVKELQVEIERSMQLYCDNKAVISIAHNLVQHDRMDYIGIDRHFIKEKIDNELICTPLISSKL